jgi:EmrB/QacA subfamily drug resistance transporter
VTPEQPEAADGDPSVPWAVAVLCLAQMILAVDITIILVANATIERALGFSALTVQWLVTAYSLTFGGFLLVGGRIADQFGRRRIFITGMAGFTLASLGAGLAESSAQLVVFRAIQGLSAAIVSPTALASLGAIRDRRVRERAYAFWAAAGSAGGVIGYAAGGALLAGLGWRWIFFINLPIGVATIAGAMVVVPRAAERLRAPQLDLAGAVSVTAGLALVIFALSEAQLKGWSSPSTLVSFTVAGLLLVTFVGAEIRAADPILPLGILRRRAALGNLISALISTVVTGAVFLGSLYMQQVFGYSPIHAGIATLPIPLGVALGAALSSRAVRKIDARLIVAAGLGALMLAMAWLARIPAEGSYVATLLPALPIFGTGLGLTLVPLISISTAGVPDAKHGIVAGIFNMSQQMGSAIGLAVLATIASVAAISVPGGGSAAEAHGIRVAFQVATLIAVAAALLALTGLPARRPGQPQA